MVIRRDIMYKVGINISFKHTTTSWEEIVIPMTDFNKLRKYNMSKFELKALL